MKKTMTKQRNFICFLVALLTVPFLSIAQSPVSDDSSKISTTNTDSIFTKVEKEAEFPGGANGWLKYLRTRLKYPDKAVNNEVQGDVVVQFIVATDGAISDLQALSGPELLREGALNVFKNSPNWIPATIGGKNVRSYKKQPIRFRLTTK